MESSEHKQVGLLDVALFRIRTLTNLIISQINTLLLPYFIVLLFLRIYN